MKGIEVVKNLLAGIGFISFFVGGLFLGGAIDSEGSVLPGVLLILFGLGCAALFIVALSYEEWQIANPDLTIDDFTLTFEKMSLDGALFDIEKLRFFSKEYLGKMDGVTLKDFVKEWAKLYNEEVYNHIELDEVYFAKIMNIIQ